MKVRTRKTPAEEELDGVRLADMTPGSVREVSTSIGAWLIAQRYAEPEMREESRAHEEDFLRRDTAYDLVRRSTRRRRHDHR